MDLGGGCRGCATPPPPLDDLRLYNTTGILQNRQICISILSSSHYVIALSCYAVSHALLPIAINHNSELLSGIPYKSYYTLILNKEGFPITGRGALCEDVLRLGVYS